MKIFAAICLIVGCLAIAILLLIALAFALGLLIEKFSDLMGHCRYRKPEIICFIEDIWTKKDGKNAGTVKILRSKMFGYSGPNYFIGFITGKQAKDIKCEATQIADRIEVEL